MLSRGYPISILKTLIDEKEGQVKERNGEITALIHMEESEKNERIIGDVIDHNIENEMQSSDEQKVMSEKVFPRIGPKIRRIATTTTATKTRISAYSTKPCPSSSCGMYNI